MDNRERPSVKIDDSQISLLLMDAVGSDFEEYDRYFNYLVKFWEVYFVTNQNKNASTQNEKFFQNLILRISLL